MNIHVLKKELTDLQSQLKIHTLYTELKSLHDIKIFMESHVFAVWDFMSLVKALQIKMTGVEIPWTPNKEPENARFINEIVLGEESDIDINKKSKSHFEMYLDAMNQIEAKTDKIDSLINNIQLGKNLASSINELKVDKRIKKFMSLSFEIIATGENHKIASAFTFGREDIIPDMFIEILKEIDPDNHQYNKLRYYLDRHIELDGDLHGPIAEKMVEKICAQSTEKWHEALYIAKNVFNIELIYGIQL